ncbi:hypothetical protein RFI_09270 [Reticulomyxa filosa]|uniref:Rhodanese domain-containing protein n=1 Tax=Reticulomyxa filosa TaxID=46433 RepID=X6NPM9_RETFI|nr:hypothetical protein RFI_09270 [Reticulomyxa filosa]|eukprot:ETO27863.1 hypothetical protein RFI_09270 [Reticulomyxa filosa]
MKSNKNVAPRVRPKLDTGFHTKNIKLIRSYHFFSPTKKDEVFKRLKVSELLTLLQSEQTNIYNKCNGENNEKSRRKNESTTPENIYAAESTKALTINECLTFSEPATSSREHNVYQKGNQETPYLLLKGDTDGPSFLLLDIRSEADFNKYHIKSARQYDTALVRKDKLGHEIYRYKNKKEKLIIICGDKEADCNEFGTSLVQKYIENVFVLMICLVFVQQLNTGTTSFMTVESFCAKYPGYCEGENIPSPPSPDSAKFAIDYAVLFY